MFFHSSAAKARLRAFPFGDQFPAACDRGAADEPAERCADWVRRALVLCRATLAAN
jgi:hypothetical protein